MRDLNIDFVDLYKRVDRFLRDAYDTQEGVSGYLRQMEDNSARGRQYVTSWEADYRRLKRLRWVRNQLSHEVGYDSDLCEEEDYLWLEDFHNRLYNTSDPLAVLYRIENAKRRQAQQQRQTEAQRQAMERQRLAQQQRQRQAALQRQAEEQRRQSQAYAQPQHSPTPPRPQPRPSPPKRETIWQRIKRFFS